MACCPNCQNSHHYQKSDSLRGPRCGFQKLGPVLQRPPRRRVRRPLGGGKGGIWGRRAEKQSRAMPVEGGHFQNISLRVREGVSLFLVGGLGQMNFAQPLGQRVPRPGEFLLSPGTVQAAGACGVLSLRVRNRNTNVYRKAETGRTDADGCIPI